MDNYFNIRYEFDRGEVHKAIARRVEMPGDDYVCVADGVILNEVNRNPEYLDVVNGGMFSICDSSYVPLYIKWIYGKRFPQYCGSSIFKDIVSSRRYRMIFLGSSSEILKGLKKNILPWNPDVEQMQFVELPYCGADEFDYKAIADMVNRDGADIIWVSLGAPKQEWFMSKLKPHLRHGVMIAVGAAFKFYGSEDIKRAPEWMIRNHLEFVHRIFSEPGKQIGRCIDIIRSLPRLLLGEYRRKRAVMSHLPEHV